MNRAENRADQGKCTTEGVSGYAEEARRQLDILSGLPGLGDYEQRAEIGDRVARGELVCVNDVWFERVDLSPEAAAAVRRGVQAAEEARPHDGELVPMPCPRCEGCGQLANTDDREPWTAWENLPPGSDLAVKAGLVRPVPCDECDGTKSVLRRKEADRG